MKYLSDDNGDRVDQYADSLRGNFEKWLGDLTDEQEQVVEQAASELKSSVEIRLNRRQQWQGGIRSILESEDDNERKSRQLREFFSAHDNQVPSRLKQVSEHNKQVIARLTVRLVRKMTEEQKAHFVSTTNDYIRMFSELAEER